MLMAAPDSSLLPLVDMQAASNVGNQWVALTLRIDESIGDQSAAWHALFATPDLLAAVAPLDCVLLISSPAILTPAVLDLLPPNRVMFAIGKSVV